MDGMSRFDRAFLSIIGVTEMAIDQVDLHD